MPSEPHEPVWQGRLAAGLDPRARRLNDSLPVDGRLVGEELALSRAYATTLAECGVMGEAERDALIPACDDLERRLRGGDAAPVRPRLARHAGRVLAGGLELARRGGRPRFRAPVPERGGHARHPRLAARGRSGALLLARLRLVLGPGRVLDGLEPAAAEAEPRPLRARAREERALDRQRAAARHALERPAELVPEGPPGGQGNGLRHGRHARSPARGAAARDRRARAGS